MVTSGGDTDSIDEQTVAALVAGSYAATREMAKAAGRGRVLGSLPPGKAR